MDKITFWLWGLWEDVKTLFLSPLPRLIVFSIVGVFALYGLRLNSEFSWGMTIFALATAGAFLAAGTQLELWTIEKQYRNVPDGATPDGRTKHGDHRAVPAGESPYGLADDPTQTRYDD